MHRHCNIAPDGTRLKKDTEASATATEAPASKEPVEASAVTGKDEVPHSGSVSFPIILF